MHAIFVTYIVYHIDGQYLASRLSKSIVKESVSLKQLIKEYNKLVSPDEHLL